MERTFEMTGFSHVTREGAIDYMCTMDSEGSISMLWDMSNQRRVDILMQTPNFDMSAYCKARSTDEETFDKIMVELHEELVDARFALEHAFIQNLTNIDCPVGERTFRNLDCITKSEVWNSPICYPLPTAVATFDLHKIDNGFSNYCCDHSPEEVVKVRIIAEGDGYASQDFLYNVCGAEPFNALCGMINEMLEIYPVCTATVIK